MVVHDESPFQEVEEETAASTVIFATGGYDNTIKLWDALTGICTRTIPHPESHLNSIVISRDKKLIIAAGNPHARVYDLSSTSNTAFLVFEGHNGNVTSVGFQRDNRWAFSSGDDGYIKIWDMRTSRIQREYNAKSSINQAVLHPNQADIVVCCQNGMVKVFDLAANTCVQELMITEENMAMRCSAVSSDGRILVGADDEGMIYAWMFNNEGKIANMFKKFKANEKYSTKIVLSPDLTKLALTSSDHSIKIWEITGYLEDYTNKNDQNSTNNIDFSFDKSIVGHSKWVWDAGFSADSVYLVSGSTDGTAKLWDIKSGECIRQYNGHGKGITCGSMLAAADDTPLSSNAVLTAATNYDSYSRVKELEQALELLQIQEELIKDEVKHLRVELKRAADEIKRIQAVPLLIGQFLEPIDESTGIVSTTSGSTHIVKILSTLDKEALKPGVSVSLHRHSNALIGLIPPEADSTISVVGETERPDVSYSDIGGLDMQKQEIREAVELPLSHYDLYRQIGIDPPRGVLLYGPPGTGKTMLVKAVAHHTKAAFIRVVGSEFVQKYLGEGPRMVRDVFRLAREKSPSIVFIDEVDAIATKRFDAQTGADREVQRVLLELLNQMDGFDQGQNVKVIMATNRADTLDPALLRPGRLDRKIEFPMPDRRQKRLVFATITSKMNLSDEVDLEEFVSRPDRLSSADIAAICQEAGMQAVRKNRYVILTKDLEKGYSSHVKKSSDDFEFYK